MLHEDWTFISSVYYGVTAMSTGGLQTPNGRSAFSMMFTGIYVLIGVPLYVVFYYSVASTSTPTLKPTHRYGCCLGIFANALVQKAADRREEEKLNAKISKEEFKFVQMINQKKHGPKGDDDDDDDDEAEPIDKYQFFEMELLRAGVVDLDFLEQVEETFDRFDVDKSGSVSWLEMVAYNAFGAVDVDDSGEIDYNEFVNLMNNMDILQRVLKEEHDLKDEKFIKQVFTACNTDNDGNDNISRLEFGKFIEAVSSGKGELDKFLAAPGKYVSPSKRKKRSPKASFKTKS